MTGTQETQTWCFSPASKNDFVHDLNVAVFYTLPASPHHLARQEPDVSTSLLQLFSVQETVDASKVIRCQSARIAVLASLVKYEP